MPGYLQVNPDDLPDLVFCLATVLVLTAAGVRWNSMEHKVVPPRLKTIAKFYEKDNFFEIRNWWFGLPFPSPISCPGYRRTRWSILTTEGEMKIVWLNFLRKLPEVLMI